MKILSGLFALVLLLYGLSIYSLNKKINNLIQLIEASNSQVRANHLSINELENKISHLSLNNEKSIVDFSHLSTKTELEEKLLNINQQLEQFSKELLNKHNAEDCPCLKKNEESKVAKKSIKTVKKQQCSVEKINLCIKDTIENRNRICQEKIIPSKTDTKFLKSQKQISSTVSVEKETVIVEHQSRKIIKQENPICFENKDFIINKCKKKNCY